MPQAASHTIGGLSGGSTVKVVKNPFFTLWTPFLANFPKNWQIEHNGDKIIDRLSRFEHENYRKLLIFREIDFFKPNPKNRLFWLFLAIFLLFGHPQNDPKRNKNAGKWTRHVAQYVSFKKSPILNHLALSIRRNGPNQPKKCHLKFVKKAPPM